MAIFSNKLKPAEKAAHSLSNCQTWALNSQREQKLFPLKPTYSSCKRVHCWQLTPMIISLSKIDKIRNLNALSHRKLVTDEFGTTGTDIRWLSMENQGQSGKLGQQAHSRKFTLVDLPTLVELTRVKFMRLHSRKTFLAGKKYKYRYPRCYTYINETFLTGKKYNYRLCRKWPVATRQVVCTYTGHQ